MKMIREVLRLHHSCNLNNKQISDALGRSRGAVTEYLHRAKAAGLTWPLPEDLSDTELEQRLFPKIDNKKKRPLPDFSEIHLELQKKGVTLLQLWAEYREEHTNGYGFTQFCHYYNEFAQTLGLVMRQEHKAGDKCFSDFAGKKLAITIDPGTGLQKMAHLFVCTLGASNRTFADLYWNETAESWCNGHAAAFEYFGGCPKVCVPDNPKAVINKPCRYEPEINESFAQMAAHYDMVVLPARVRKPKDKAKVEAAVGVATRWILAVLRKPFSSA
ncbi:MAG: IS21 family transposase [Candidatus Obscuribacterales bacterium]|jgi:transposase|nr:IS21 family transposase [Candidatus Obscuribacterales bacterium]